MPNTEYFTPKNISEALSLLRRWKGKVKLVAGGTNVNPDMRAKVIKPEVLIDISQLKNLSLIKEEKQKIKIGALTTISDLASSEVIKKYAPVLYEAARQIGNPLVRNRATLAGNLANASPAADTAVPLLVLDASILVERKGVKPRQIPLERFFAGPNRTVLKKDEVIREITFPKPKPAEKMAYTKFGLRNSMAISVVSLAVLVELEKGLCKKVRIGLGAVAPKPTRAYETERILTGKEISEKQIASCCERVGREVSPITGGPWPLSF